MSLPPLAPLPPANIRLSIAPADWEACLEAWLTLTDLYLRLPLKDLASAVNSGTSLTTFLHTFYRTTARPEHGDHSMSGPNAQSLKKTCFMLVRRILLEADSVGSLLEYHFLANFSHAHMKSAALRRLMDSLWKRKDQALQKSMQKARSGLISSLAVFSESSSPDVLSQLADIMLASPDVAALLMTGSDLVDALAVLYTSSKTAEQKKAVVATMYLGLTSLVKITPSKITPSNISLLSDHLYSLRAEADTQKQTSLLADLVTNTPIIAKLRHSLAEQTSARLMKLVDTLDTYRSPSIARPRKSKHSYRIKGKARAVAEDGAMHVHRMSLVTQVQDLFPDLGSGFVLKLLDEYQDDAEQVISHLLDDSLPSHLRDADRTEQAHINATSKQAEIESLVPRSTPPPVEHFVPERRNVFDNDEFDRLEVDASRLNIGKKKDVPEEGQANKAAILSALAAFDSDDDERDDTYDVEDVGGTVDNAHPDGEPGPSAKVTQEENDMALFTTYRATPELFGRTFDVRKGQARQALKRETGMTDEAIEGWAIMLGRDPRRLQRLERQSGAHDGRQNELSRTAYRESATGTETEDSDVPTDRGGWRGRGRGRSRGQGGRARGGGGDVAGSSNDPSTALAQRRKETNKSGRANHNRRDQRARKMARGGFAA